MGATIEQKLRGIEKRKAAAKRRIGSVEWHRTLRKVVSGSLLRRDPA